MRTKGSMLPVPAPYLALVKKAPLSSPLAPSVVRLTHAGTTRSSRRSTRGRGSRRRAGHRRVLRFERAVRPSNLRIELKHTVDMGELMTALLRRRTGERGASLRRPPRNAAVGMGRSVPEDTGTPECSVLAKRKHVRCRGEKLAWVKPWAGPIPRKTPGKTSLRTDRLVRNIRNGRGKDGPFPL